MERILEHIDIKMVFILILLFTVMPLFATPSSSEKLSESGVNIYIDGPKEVFVNQTIKYHVEIGGSFGKSAQNWSLKVEEGEDFDVSPVENESMLSNEFIVNLTVKNDGEATLKVKGFCSDGEDIRYSQSSLKVNAVKPVKATVEITNPTDIELEDVKVGLFVDSDLKNTIVIDKLGANETRKLQINWSKEGLDMGDHKLEVWVDYGYEDSGRFIKDELVLQKTFYVTGQGFWDKYGVLIGVSVVLSIIGFLYYMNRRKKRRRPW